MNLFASLKNIFSLKEIADSLLSNFKRFPLSIIFSTLSTLLLVSAVYLESNPLKESSLLCLRWGLVCLLGIGLSFAVEISSFSKKYLAFGPIILFLSVFAYYFNIGKDGPSEIQVYRYLAFGLSTHFLISYLPFIKPLKENILGFWDYNKSLFLSIVLAFVFSGTLFAGISLALLSLDILFDFEVPDKSYAYLFILCNIFTNTQLFLARLPKKQDLLDTEIEYPSALRYFAQYILMSLAIIYLAILYVYEAKIIAAWNLPKGWVSILVMFFVVIGMLTYLLLYPLKETKGWLQKYHKFFYFSIVPLIGLLVAAIYPRVSKYGLTDQRGFLILLILWVAGISFYFILNPRKNIKMIPLSLSLLCFLAVWGPWSVFEFSDRSQANRIKKIAQEAQILDNGILKISDKSKINNTQKANLYACLKHFTGGYQKTKRNYSYIQTLFNKDLDSLYTVKKGLDMIEFEKIIGKINFVNKTYLNETKYISFKENKVYKSSGFDYVLNLNIDTENPKAELENFKFFINKQNELFLDNEKMINLESTFKPYLDSLEQHNYIKTISGKTNKWIFKFEVNKMRMDLSENEKLNFEYFNTVVYLRKR
jgi:hypothetical protein